MACQIGPPDPRVKAPEGLPSCSQLASPPAPLRFRREWVLYQWIAASEYWEILRILVQSERSQFVAGERGLDHSYTNRLRVSQSPQRIGDYGWS